MRSLAHSFALVLSLAACRASSSTPVEPSSLDGLDGQGATQGERPLAFDLDGFEPPFGRVPLSADFVRAHELRRIVMHEDVDTDDVRLVDVTVTTLEYDREGHLLRSSVLDRGEPLEEVRYEYADDRLAAEVHAFPNGPGFVLRYAYDADGRVQRVERDMVHGSTVEHRTYDEHGRPSLFTQTDGQERAELRFVYEDERLRRVVLTLPDEGRELVTEHGYDASGRPTRRVRRDGRGDIDVYEFAWDARGQLRAQSFAEGDAPIYRRTYAYDEEGRPLRERLESFVPAMGRGSLVRYEYEHHGELPREVATVASTESPKAALLEATVAAFRGAYQELAIVSFETMDEGRFVPSSVMVYVPEAIVGRQSEDALKQQACAAKQALGMGCDCEWVTLGEAIDHAWHSWPDKRVVPVTFHLGIGC